MNLDTDDSEREEVLHRYFIGELTAEERAEVEAWASVSADNQRLFDEAELFAKDLKGLAIYRNATTVTADQSWERFKKDNKIRAMRPSGRSQWLRYAASVLITMGAVIGIYYFQQLPQDQMIASTETVQELTLPEGSTIALNTGSQITYQEPFQNNERRVRLQGEGYFDITSDPNKPFVVEAGQAEIRVLGTKFYIDQSDDAIEVKVEEGKVLVSYKDQHQLLQQDEGITLDLKTEVMADSEEDVTGVQTFWKTRRLAFRLTPLDEVVKVVSEAYNTQVQLNGPATGCELTVTFENEPLENVLAVIAGTLNYELTQNQGVYTLTGDGCQ